MDANERCATRRGWRARLCGAAPEGRWRRAKQTEGPAKGLARCAMPFARHAEFRHFACEAHGLARDLVSLARKPWNLACRAGSFARRVAALHAPSKKPCTPRCRACERGFRACARGSKACARGFSACAPGEMAGARAPVRDLEVSTALVIVRTIQIQTLGGGAWERVLGCWGGMGGCSAGMAGLLPAARRWWAGVLAMPRFSGTHKAGKAGRPGLEKRCQSNTYHHVRMLVRVD